MRFNRNARNPSVSKTPKNKSIVSTTDILITHLERKVFDYEAFRNEKIRVPCTVPCTLVLTMQ